MVEYVKLLRIKYNNKVFDIFNDEANIKQFIEVKFKDGKEEFCHPNLSDRINLNLIYNTNINKKYSIKDKNNNSKSPSIKQLKIEYENFKKIGNLITKLAYISIAGIIILTLKDKIDAHELPTLTIGAIEIENNSELDDYNINNVTFDEVRKTLANNENFSKKYKNMVNEYIDKLEEKMPEVDLRLLNENLKTMEFKTYLSKKLEDENAAGAYNANTNTLEICTGYDNKTIKNIMFHELTHALTTFSDNVHVFNSKVICNQRVLKQYEKNRVYGESLDEGFTEVITNYLLSSSTTQEDYFKVEEREFVSYSEVIAPTCYKLLRLTQNEYNLYDVVSGNVKDYIEILSKYNLEGIVDYLDTIKKSEENKINIIDSYEFNEYIIKIENLLKHKEKTSKNTVKNLNKIMTLT